MRWPPNKSWTSTQKRQGYRHFAVKDYGGKGNKRWVELFPLLNKEINLKVLWKELNTDTQWESGWRQLTQEEECIE